jgi:hypothetical protein
VKFKALDVLAKFAAESVSISTKLAGELFTIFTAQLPKIRHRELPDFLPAWLSVAQSFGSSWVELPEELAGPMYQAIGAVLSSKQILHDMSILDPAFVWFLQWTLRRSRRLELITAINFTLDEPSLYLAARFMMFPDSSAQINPDLQNLITQAAFGGSARIAKCLSMTPWTPRSLQSLSLRLLELTEMKDWAKVNSALSMLPLCSDLPQAQSLLHTWFEEGRTDFTSTLLRASSTHNADDIAGVYRISVHKARDGLEGYKEVVSACVAVLPTLVDVQLKELKRASILGETVFILGASLLTKFDRVTCERLLKTSMHKAGRKSLLEHSVPTALLGRAVKLLEEGHRAEAKEYAWLVGQLAQRCDNKACLRVLSRQLKEASELGSELKELVLMRGVSRG